MTQSLLKDESPTATHAEIYDGLTVTHTPAPHHVRLFAFLLDVGFAAIGTYLFYIIGVSVLTIVAAGGAMADKGEGEVAGIFGSTAFVTMVIILVLGGLVINSGYFIYNEYKKGMTVGKRLFGLRVVSLDGRRLTFGQVVLRDLLRLVDCWMVIPGVIALIMNKEHRRLGDLVAGTMVVYSPTQEAKWSFLYLAQDDYLVYFEKLAPKPVPPEDGKAFLRFAYPTMISRQRVAVSDADFERLNAMVAHYVPNGAASGLSPDDLRRFFAEHCHQCANRRP